MQETKTLQGKVCMVTGATGGIGKETALALAKQGATVVLVGRQLDRTAAVAAEIRSASGNTQVEYLLADLTSLAQVRQLAADFQATYPHLHVLVNNAGGLYGQRTVTADGFEATFVLNVLAPLLLTHLLLPTLQVSAPARVIIVSSMAHVPQRLDFADLQSTQGYAPMRVYGRAKLAAIMLTYELARRLAGTGVTVNALHPGVVNTNFGSDSPMMRLGMKMIMPFLLSPTQGAQTSIYLAASPAVAGVTGQYFVRSKAVRSNRASYDEAAQRRLWDVCMQMVGLKTAPAAT